MTTPDHGAPVDRWSANNRGRADSSGEHSGERVEVVVVGSGQAAQATGYFLARQGRRFVILEAANTVGVAWRNRWDSLRLFTPRRYDSLPELAFPGDPDGYPTRDEVVTYLERSHVETLPLRMERRATSRDDDIDRAACLGQWQIRSQASL